MGQVSFAHFDISTPVEGSSIASDDLQVKVMEDLYEIVSVKMPTCTDYTIKNTQIIHLPYDVKKKNNKYIKGYWKELWGVDACGYVVQMPITFYIKRKKTLYSIDKTFFID